MKVFIVCVLFIILYFKPLYSIVFLSLFSFEFLYFLNFFSKIYMSQNYNVIKNGEIDFSDMNSLELWVLYCRYNAFARLYLIYNKKRNLKISNVIIVIIIIIMGIPYRILKLFYFFIKSNLKFHDTLENLCSNLYIKVRDLKIEVYKNKVTLNCYTSGKLVRRILCENRQITKNNLEEGISELKKYYVKEDKNKGDVIKIYLCHIYNERGKINDIPHYTHVENGNSLHSTSNSDFEILENQSLSLPIRGLIKTGAIKPATVMTKKIYDFKFYNRYKIIPKFDLDVVKYNNEGFDLDSESRLLIQDREKKVEEILKNKFGFGKKINNEFKMELISNLYWFAVVEMEIEDFRNEYDLFFKEDKLDI